jgi:hypothetical protein
MVSKVLIIMAEAVIVFAMIVFATQTVSGTMNNFTWSLPFVIIALLSALEHIDNHNRRK